MWDEPGDDQAAEVRWCCCREPRCGTHDRLGDAVGAGLCIGREVGFYGLTQRHRLLPYPKVWIWLTRHHAVGVTHH